jgi:hypothetical protein
MSDNSVESVNVNSASPATSASIIVPAPVLPTDVPTLQAMITTLQAENASLKQRADKFELFAKLGVVPNV